MTPHRLSPLLFVSPMACVLFGYGQFLACLAMPAKMYERIIGEKNYLFFDGATFAYNTASVICFLVGMFVYTAIQRRRLHAIETPPSPSLSNVDVLAVAALISLQFAGAFYFVSSGGIQQVMTALQQEEGAGDDVFYVEGESGRQERFSLGSTFCILPPFIGWLYLLHRRRGGAATWAFWLTVIVFCLIALPLARRNYITRAVFAIISVYALDLTMRKKSMAKFGAMAIAAAVAMVALFIVFQQFRKGESSDSVRDITRYIVTGYNLESMLVNGIMEYPGSGTGYYHTQWLWSFPVISKVVPLQAWRNEWLGPPAPYGAFERGPIGVRHGIIASTAITAFGSAYVDFGWLGPFTFVVSGFLCAVSWQLFKQMEFLGVYMYPFIAYSIIEWRANLLFPPPFFGYLLCFIGLYLFSRRSEHYILSRYRFTPQSVRETPVS